jgi:hypothetical protein
MLIAFGFAFGANINRKFNFTSFAH